MILSQNVLDFVCLIAILGVGSGLSTGYALANPLERQVESMSSAIQIVL